MNGTRFQNERRMWQSRAPMPRRIEMTVDLIVQFNYVIVQFKMNNRAIYPSPEWSEPEAEHKWCRHGVWIRTIVCRPRVIIRLIIRTIAVAMIAPIATLTAELARLR